MTDVERLLKQGYEAAHELPAMPPSLAARVRRRRLLRASAPVLGVSAIAAAAVVAVMGFSGHSASRPPAQLATSPTPTSGPTSTQCPPTWSPADDVPVPPADTRGGDALIPGSPDGLDYCVYAWHLVSGQPPLPERRSQGEIQGAPLSTFVSLANAIPQATPSPSPSPAATGPPSIGSCPLDDGSFVVLYARYSGQPDLMLVMRDTGCRYISNGTRLASETAGTAYTQFDQYAAQLIDTDPPQD